MASLSQLVSLPYSVIEDETLAVEIGIDRVILEGDSAVLM